MTLDDRQRDFLSSHSLATLATIKRDGRPQLSQVGYGFEPGTQTFRISVTDSRAKTRNLRRDPRATLMVTGDGPWEFLVVDGHATVGPVAEDPHDQTVEDLVALYRSLSGEHPDWDEFRTAMVDDRRLVLSVVATHAYGLLG